MHARIMVILVTLKGNFLYFQVFSEILGLSTMTVIEVQRSDLVVEHIGGTNAKTEKILKKAEGPVLFVDEAYTLSSTSGKAYWQRSDRGNDGENECEYRRENKKHNFYLCWVSLLNGRLESEPRSLKMNSKCPAVQRLYADRTRRNHQQISAYL